MRAQEAYAVLADNGKTVTFYYDTQRNSRTGTRVDISTTDKKRQKYTSATKAVFDPSFANYRPSTTAYLIDNCFSLAEIEGLNLLNTSEVTSMNSMFRQCNKLKDIDLSHFDTSKVTDMAAMFSSCETITKLEMRNFNTVNVTDMAWMFEGCSKLTSIDLCSFNTSKVTDMSYMFCACSALAYIYVGEGWTTMSVTESSCMFASCLGIIGESGTVYDNDHINHEYARIDRGTAEPGYFTNQNASQSNSEAYGVLSDDNQTITFYFDAYKKSRTGVAAIQTEDWQKYYTDITKAIFDVSMRNYRPSCTSYWFSQCKKLVEIEGLEGYVN